MSHIWMIIGIFYCGVVAMVAAIAIAAVFSRRVRTEWLVAEAGLDSGPPARGEEGILPIDRRPADKRVRNG
jgi:hypothetical protein